MRLRRVYELAAATGHVKRFILFGSFVTAKPEPNDVDVFLVMRDTFDLDQVTGEDRLVFDHLKCGSISVCIRESCQRPSSIARGTA